MNETPFLKRVWEFIKRHWILSALAVVIVVVSVFALLGGKKAVPNTVTVARGSIREEVSATGNVKPVHSVDLAFEKSGRIAAVNANVGNKVYAGELIVNLERGDLEAQLSKAEADLASQKADLDKANVDLANYFGSIPDLLNDAYAKADDAVRKQLDGLFVNDELQNPTLSFSVKNVSIDNDVRSLRVMATAALSRWSGDLGLIGNAISPGEMNNYIGKATGYLSTIRALLSRSMDAVMNAADSSLSSSLADTYKASVSTGRTNVNTAMSNLTNREQAIVAEKATVASLQAGIKSYEASMDNIRAQISKMAIYSPISGVVTVQNAKVGEIAPAGTVMVSIISASRFEVEANVAEADITKVKAGDAVQITLDAYGSDTFFDAKVSSIDPAETMVEGVATYKTKFQFLKDDDRVKSGMTANITISTDKRENVLVIPQRVVSVKNGVRTVLLDRGNGKSEERTIETGLKGVDGNIEVLSGLNEGDRVVMSNSL